MAEAFAPGTPVVLRGLFRRRIWVAQDAMVVSNSPERTVLALEPGRYYSINQYWSDAEGRFLCWYINFPLPFVRFPLGFDTLDLVVPTLPEGWNLVA